jgi:SEC-C motif-containing protein
MNPEIETGKRPCPCGSGQPLRACCQDYLADRRKPATAEALMRSRYTAYVLKHADYLLATWHASTRPPKLTLDANEPTWLGLRIEFTKGGREADAEGVVEFTARFRQQGTERQLHEVSRFRREMECWFYVDGETRESRISATAAAQTGRNDPCPCGSGMKFKRCCGR